MKIIYLDTEIAVIIKPAGTLSEGNGENCLPAMLSLYLRGAGEKNTDVYPVHRLDRETTGLTVFARTPRAAAALSQSIRTHSFKKQYLAVLHGTPDTPSGTLCDLLYFDRKRGKSFVVDRERSGVKSASLDYTLLATLDGLSLVEVSLHTGRTHQIRVQFSSRRLPLVGDRRYGAPKSEYSGIALHAHKLSFPHPQSGEPLTFTCPVPDTLPWIYFDNFTQST